MCKTLHYTWLIVNLALGIVTQMNATLSPETLLLQFHPDHSQVILSGDTRIKDQEFVTKTFPTPDLLDSIESYLELAITPFDLSPTPYLFIEEL